METIILPTFSLTTVLVGYLVTQLVVSAIIYWLLSSAANRQLRVMFAGAGREHFNKGFDQAAQDKMMELMRESQRQSMMSVYEHINHELASTTAVTRDLVADRLREIDGRLLDLRDTIRKVEAIREDMHDTNTSVASLHDKLGKLFEKLNAN